MPRGIYRLSLFLLTKQIRRTNPMHLRLTPVTDCKGCGGLAEISRNQPAAKTG
jgi:hypothetical protein